MQNHARAMSPRRPKHRPRPQLLTSGAPALLPGFPGIFPGFKGIPGFAFPDFLPVLRAYSGFQVPQARPTYAATLGRLGPLEVRLARNAADVRRAQRLRFQVFYQEMSAVADAGTMLAPRAVPPL